MTKLSLRRIGVLATMMVALSVARPATAQTLIPQSGWKLLAVDSQETADGDYRAIHAFDGDPSTMWHTAWTSGSPTTPHDLQIDLGGTYAVTAFRYLPRNDGASNGRISGYQFYVSTDGVTWGTAVATGTFSNSAAEQQVDFTAKTGRYVRLRATSEVTGQPWTAVAELNVLSAGGAAGGGTGGGSVGGVAGGAISQAGWTLLSVDSQETVDGDYRAIHAFDGDPSTMWHTSWSSGTSTTPHEIQINLGASYSLTGFRYLPRNDGTSNGRIGGYQFYVSTDGSSWGTAVATGTFANTATEQQVDFTAKTGRYIRLRATSEVAGQPWTAVAEINVLAAGSSTPTPPASNQAPSGTITAPAANTTIAQGQSVTFSGSGSDPDNNLPLTYSWSFGSGGPGSSSAQNPGAVVFPNPGVYTVSLTVTDAVGGSDASPATRTITVQDSGGSGGSTSSGVISQAAWTVLSVDSQETAAGNYAATRAFDGNSSTMWHTGWSSGSTTTPHELQINLGGSYSLTGFRYQPRTDSENGRIGRYEFYVSTDGVSWGSAVASGTFQNSPTEQQVDFTAKTGRYVRLRALSEVNGGPWTSVAELKMLGSSGPSSGGNQLPTISLSGTLDSGTATLSATASDSDGSVAKVEFYVNGSLISTDTSAPYRATTSNLLPGVNLFIAVAQDNAGDRTASASVNLALGSGQASRQLVFTPSADHDSLVLGYVLDVFRSGQNPSTATATASLDIGRPDVISGECTVDISSLVASLPSGTYIATVTAIGTAGDSRSSASSAFTAP